MRADTRRAGVAEGAGGNRMVVTLQPDPDPQHRTLVQREGVDAGSDASTVEGDRDLPSPSVDPDYDGASLRPTPADDEADSALAPSTAAAESGQDNGSMS